MDLSTDYMGLRLRNPLVASPSPLSYTVEGVRGLADAGVGAVVLYSLFEEQVRELQAHVAELVDGPAESFAEALDYVPQAAKEDVGSGRYLRLLEQAAASVEIPVIASLNGTTPAGWTEYARDMQEAGAAGIELNISYLPADPETSGGEVEQRHLDVLERVKQAVSVPVAVKLSPYFSSIGAMALRFDRAGADALVLFNRFLQPDIDPDELAILPHVTLSHPDEGRLPRTWIALLRGRITASLAATSGVEDGRRRRALPPRRRRCRHDHLRAAAARRSLRGRPAGRPREVDGAQGIRHAARAAGHARRARRRRPGGIRARRIRRRDARRQRRRLQPLGVAPASELGQSARRPAP